MLVQIDYELRFDAPFHLGTGVTAGLIDRTVIRDADHNLYVPASTFKGVLREHCEQLCRFYVLKALIASPHDPYAALAQFGKAPPLISRIFGSPLHPGGLRFNDVKQQRQVYSVYRDIQTSISTQVRIDRATHTAADEALYTSEYGTRYLVFEGKIKGLLNCIAIEELAIPVLDGETYTLTPSYSLLILLAGLLMIERLGGNKSAGKGQCNCAVTNILLDRHKCTQEQWQSWIERLNVLEGYPVDEQGDQA